MAYQTVIGFLLMADLTWIKAMEACAENNQAPFDPGKLYKPDKKWTGTVRYNRSCGIVTLQIEKTEDDREKHCSGKIHLPTPTHCMMNQGNSSQYISCDEEISDGCQEIDKGSFSRLRISLSFTNARDEYCKDEPCRDTMIGLVLPVKLPWITAMETCANYRCAPFDPGEHYEPDKKWTGTVKYNMSFGIVTLQIEKSEDDREKNCSAFILPLLNATIWRNGTYCLSPLSEILEGTNGYKCILADFNNLSIKDVPTPTHCMMNQGNSSQYISCEERIDDGCQKIDSNSQLRITLSFTNATKEFCEDEPCEAVNPEECCLISLTKQCKFYLIVFFVILVGILDVACICCCVRCQTRRQSIKEDRSQERVRRPYSETIEVIYINQNISSQNDTNEVVTNPIQRTEARLRIVQQNNQENDMEVSRIANSRSGDYNLAWQGGGCSTTVSSTDMDTIPEEEIYSKQKLVWEDGNDAITQPSFDDQTRTEYSNEALNNHKKVTDWGIKHVEITNSNTLAEAPYSTVVIVDQKQHVQKAGYNKADDDIYSTGNINDTKQQIKEEVRRQKSEKPLQSIKSVDKSSCIKKQLKQM